MKTLYCVISILFLVSIANALAATYYVATNGNDAATGDASHPWLTLGRATRQYTGTYLSAGDTLVIRGGLYTGNGNMIDCGKGNGRSGTSNAPITVKAYPGESVTISQTLRGFPTVLLYDKAWWTFDSLTFSNCFQFMALVNVTNFVVTNCVFTTMPENSVAAYSGVGIQGASQFNKFQNCTFAEWGSVTGPGGTNAYGYVLFGCPLKIGNEEDPRTCYNLVEDCTFYSGGHDLIEITVPHNVIRNNDFHNEPFFRTNSTYRYLPNWALPRNEVNKYGAYSARIMKPNDAGESQDDYRNVFEGNRMHYTGPPCDSGGSFGIELGTRRSIYRYNTIAYTLAAGVIFNTSGTTTLSTSNAVYNNVIFSCGLATLHGGVQMQSYCYGLSMSTLEGRRTNNFIVNNIFWGNHPNNVDPTIYKYQSYRVNWNGDGNLPYPMFVNTNGYGDYFRTSNLPDFQLQAGSPCIDAGTWLAFIKSSNGSGTSFTVDNSLYFSDGNRIVEGDTIQLQGQTNRAVIVTNDYIANRITFLPALTWTNGQGVALAYNGRAPDMGAFESSYDGSTPSAKPGSPSAVRVIPPGK